MRIPLLLFVATMLFALPLAAEVSESPRIAPDESSTVAELIDAGAPASDREWSADDYGRFVSVVQKIAAENPRKLPRFDSPNSGALMARAVSESNFALLHDQQLPVSVRLPHGLALTNHGRDLLLTYVNATNKGGESFDRELVELAAFAAGLSAHLWTLADEFLATLTPEERAARTGALDTMRAGAAQVLAGVIATFTETNTYRPAELQRLASLVAGTFPALLGRLTPESRAEAIVRLRTVAGETSDEKLAASLRALLEAAEKSEPAAKKDG